MRADIILGKLPNPFIFENGTGVKTISDWEERRKEIIDTAVELEFGGMPSKPDHLIVKQLNGGSGRVATCYRIKCFWGDQEFTFCFSIFMPEKPQKKSLELQLQTLNTV